MSSIQVYSFDVNDKVYPVRPQKVHIFVPSDVRSDTYSML